MMVFNDSYGISFRYLSHLYRSPAIIRYCYGTIECRMMKAAKCGVAYVHDYSQFFKTFYRLQEL